MSLPRLELTDLLRRSSQRPITLVGRSREQEQMARTVQRRLHNNLLIIGPAGAGKTSLLHGFIQAVSAGQYPHLIALPYVQLSTEQLTMLLREASDVARYLTELSTAFSSLPRCVVVMDTAERWLESLGEEWHLEQMVQPFHTSHDRRLVMSISQASWDEHRTQWQPLFDSFTILHLQELSLKQTTDVVQARAPQLAAHYGLTITADAIEAVVESSQQVHSERAQPDRALRFLDEVCAACSLAVNKQIHREAVQQVLSQQLGLPSGNRQQHVHTIYERLSQKIQGQPEVVETVAEFVQTAWLGLKNPHRPLGSFLFLGPSGVGKTELAKAITSEVYGDERALLRLDMSEFSEPHMVQRLVGSPPGYVGYEAGGQLTDFVKKQPFSLLLLDEIEKAHPTVFDIFLQLLDDGRLTDGHGSTVDFTKTIVIATSNSGSREIAVDAAAGYDTTSAPWLHERLMPLLLQRFRPEFLNRFSALLTFRPLTEQTLLAIAKLEIAKIEQRFSNRHLTINVSEAWLQQKIAALYNPLFGARPIKQFIEATCEHMIAQQLLSSQKPSL